MNRMRCWQCRQDLTVTLSRTLLFDWNPWQQCGQLCATCPRCVAANLIPVAVRRPEPVPIRPAQIGSELVELSVLLARWFWRLWK